MSTDDLTERERYEYFLFKLIDEGNILVFSGLLSEFIKGGNDPKELRLPIPRDEAVDELEQFVEERAIPLPYNLLQYAAYSRKFEFVKLLHEKFEFPLNEDLSWADTADQMEILKLTFGFAQDLDVEAIAWFALNDADFRIPLEAQIINVYSPLHAAMFSYANALHIKSEDKTFQKDADIQGEESLVNMFSKQPTEDSDEEDVNIVLEKGETVLAILAPRSNLDQEVPVNITSGWPRPVASDNEKIDYLSARQIMLLLKDSGVPKPLSDLFMPRDNKPYNI